MKQIVDQLGWENLGHKLGTAKMLEEEVKEGDCQVIMEILGISVTEIELVQSKTQIMTSEISCWWK